MAFVQRSAQRLCIVLATLFSASAHAQGSATTPQLQPPGTGSVTGMVQSAETRLPIRFAEIRLVRKPSEEELLPSEVPLAPKLPVLVRLASGSSTLDGSFRLEGVPPGDYYVAASKPGYRSPGGQLSPTASDEQVKAVIASLTTVHVAAGQTATLTLTVTRGAVLAGRVQFADGSPATGTGVSADQAENSFNRPDLMSRPISTTRQVLVDLDPLAGTTRGAATDDEGRFRISGLVPGKYILVTGIALPNSPAAVEMKDGSQPPATNRNQHLYPEMILVYAPASFRRHDARVFELRQGQQITDALLTIDPAGLHSLRGKVLAGSDHHVPNGTLVQLQESEEKGSDRLVEIEVDGSFQFHLLSSGAYTLKVIANDLNGPDSMPMIRTSYKSIQQRVLLGDHDLVLDDLHMTALKPGETDPGTAP